MPYFRSLGAIAFSSACLCAAGCGNGGRDLAPQAPAISDSKDKGVEGEHRPSPALLPKSAPEGTPAASASRSRGDTLFSFAENLSMAHLRSGGGLLIDFGTPARHKYTLGDWRSGWRGDYVDAGTTFSYAGGATAKILFDLAPEEAGGGTLTLRARAAVKQKGRVYLNGEQIGVAEFASGDFEDVALPIGKGLRPGRNEILLRFNVRRPVHDGGSASLAVDYVRVGFSDKDAGSAASSFDAVLEKSSAEGARGGVLTLSAGESLTYVLPVPETPAAIVGSLTSTDGGSLAVSIRAEDGRRVDAQRRVGKPRPESFSVNLSEFAKSPAAISIAAEGGAVRIADLAIELGSEARKNPPVELPKARNVVLVLIDTTRADHLKPFLPKARVVTDQLVRTASESFVFQRASVQENWTMPSTATVLTGLFPTTHRTKTETNKVPESVTLASQHFQKLGFATAAFVANGYVSGKFGFERGWDRWINYVREGKPNRAQFVADDVISWLEKRDKEKRFFLYVHAIDPHVPYIPPREYRAKYDDAPYSGPVEGRDTAKLLERIKVGAVRLNDRDKRRLEALYDGELSYHDDHLARIFAAFESAGLLDDTLIVITSDHGEEFFDHGSVGHGHSLYEELLHVPLIVRAPGAKPGSGVSIEEEVGTVDVLPTACELLAVPCPSGVEGRSLVPLIEGDRTDAWPRAVFSEFLDGQRAARLGRYKIILRGSSTTLFDLAVDPDETRDLSDEAPYALSLMRERLGAHLGRFVDTGRVGERGARKKARHESESVTIDKETRAQLEALGYMGN